ncbi:MAG TPA: sigma-70 family RNA polymerase sigma factor [Candidatus Baltobacteraceae bacterium]
MDDASRLLARVADRDTAAFEQLYDTYHRLVYGIAVRMLTDVSSAEDLTQSVFLKLWSAPAAFRGGNFVAWLCRVTRNRALDILRSKAARPDGKIPCPVAVEDPIEDMVFARLDSERVRKALADLPEEQRALIELGFFGGITHDELARRTATPLGTVKTRIRAGLRKLRGALEEHVVT